MFKVFFYFLIYSLFTYEYLLHSLSVDISKTDAKKTTLKRERQKKRKYYKVKEKIKSLPTKVQKITKTSNIYVIAYKAFARQKAFNR